MVTSESFARSLPDSLLASSRNFCISALEALQQEKNEVFMLHAAVALEQLAKAALARKHPSLIAAEDFDSLLHTTGHSRHARRPPQRMKSISMTEALKRCSQFVRGLSSFDAELQLLGDVRNGVAHLGESWGEMDTVLVPYLQATRRLLSEIGVSDQYFGPHRAKISEVLEKASQETEDDVRIQIATAKADFAKRFKGTDPDWVQSVRDMTVAAYALDSLELQLHPCPACETPAFVEGTLVPDYEFDEEVDDGVFTVHGILQSVDFYPMTLVCKVCGLTLEAAELEAANVPDSWTLEGYDEDQLREWEQRGWEYV